MKTRQATIKELQLQLKETLFILDKSEKCNLKLVSEREDSEQEIRSICDKNTILKQQLVNLDLQLQDVKAENQRLQGIVDQNHDQCYITLDTAHNQNRELRSQLLEARNVIKQLQDAIAQRDQSEADNMYCRLVHADLNLEEKVSLNLKNTSTQTNQKHLMGSHNKIKKYTKLKKYIYKTKKRLIRNKVNENIFSLKRERIKLNENLNKYIHMVEIYEQNYKENTEKINKLKTDLENINRKYSLTQNIIKEYISATDVLLESNSNYPETYNTERNKTVTGIISSSNEAYGVESSSRQKTNDGLFFTVNEKNTKQAMYTTNMLQSEPTTDVLLLSDIYGKNMSSKINKCLPKMYNVLNICKPNDKQENILNDKLLAEMNRDNANDLVLMLGDYNTIKTDVHEYLSKIDNLAKTLKEYSKKLIVTTVAYKFNNNTNYKIMKVNSKLFIIASLNENVCIVDVNPPERLKKHSASNRERVAQDIAGFCQLPSRPNRQLKYLEENAQYKPVNLNLKAVHQNFPVIPAARSNT